MFLLLLQQIFQYLTDMLKPLVFTLSAMLFCGGIQAQQSLGYTLREGDVFTVEQRGEQIVSQQLGEGFHQLTNRIAAVLEFRVRESRDTSYLLEFRFRDLFFKIESDMQGVLLNIRARELDTSDLQSRVFNSLIDVPVSMEISRRGEILRVVGGDSLVSRMMASTHLAPGTQRSAMQHTLDAEYSSKALAASFEQMTFFYPARRVRTGDHWQNRLDGGVEALNTWTLDTYSDGSAGISGEADIRMRDGGRFDGAGLSGRQTIQVQTEAGSGFIRKMVVSGEASGNGPAAVAGGDPVPTRIRTKSSYTLIDHKHVQ
ncbi:DUF6263 family protein [Robiginitalea sp. SC105]|uniref:DUF6263 family protein n=1 Tax=Robiginitalea sp. SC105 TaxID=2762332 RepID=UPI00163A7702|nr:DUF6263 family protein [Robiginitalea sp. SC105]MBC2839443.1 hypothetical protein [Robiginitalea sp. SC105]